MSNDQAETDSNEDEKHDRLKDAEGDQMILVGAQYDTRADFDGGEDGRDAEDGRNDHAEREAEDKRLGIDFPD